MCVILARFVGSGIGKPSDFIAPIGAGIDLQSILLGVPAAPESEYGRPSGLCMIRSPITASKPH
jgi:hypothetical protein